MCLITAQKFNEEEIKEFMPELTIPKCNEFFDGFYGDIASYTPELNSKLNISIAEEDIVCYKRLVLDMKGDLCTPIMHTPVEYRTYMVSDEPIRVNALVCDEMEFDDNWNTLSTTFRFSISHGIHVLSENIQNIYGMIYKCIIPKGTKYVLGLHNEIVAEKVFLTDEIIVK